MSRSKKNFLSLLAGAAMFSGDFDAGMDQISDDIIPRRSVSKVPLSKKQLKSRTKSKQAKKSRKINRQKRK